MRLFLLQRQTIKQPLQFPPGDLHGGGTGVSRPLKSASFQAPVVEPESVVLPVENLDLITLAIAKDKQGGSEWIQRKGLADQYRQPVD